MDTIAKHSKRLTETFSKRDNAEEIIASAKKLAVLVLQNEELHLRHRRAMIKNILWWISEAHGKYTTQYRSKAVVALALSDPTSTEKVQHEHVFPRAKVADQMLKEKDALLRAPAKLDQLLSSTVGCVVLASEHRQLDNHAEGWRRYAKVPVLDMSTTPPTEVPTTGVSQVTPSK